MVMRVGQISGFADQANLCPIAPRFADARVKHWRFNRWVTADQLDHLGVIKVFDPRVADITETVSSRQLRAIGATFDDSALPFDQLLQRKRGFDR